MELSLSQALWSFLQPSSLLLLLLAASIRYRRLLWLVLALCLALATTPLADYILWPLEHHYSRAAPADDATILVLGGAEDYRATAASGQAQTNAAAERMIAFWAWVKQGGHEVVYIDVPPPSGLAPIVADIGAQLQLAQSPQAYLALSASNSCDSPSAAQKVLPIAPDGRFALLTSAWHMPRAMLTFKTQWPQAHFVAVPVDYRAVLQPFWRWDFVGGLARLDLAAREYAGLLYYRLNGCSNHLWPQEQL